jgi:hypothetical protein
MIHPLIRTSGFLPAVSIVGLALGLGCGGKNETSAPAITYFAATRSTITLGQATALVAGFTGGSGVIDQGVGAIQPQTSRSVSPIQNVTYTLTVTGQDGRTARATATVAVLGTDLSGTQGLSVVAPNASAWTTPSGIANPAFEPADQTTGTNEGSYGAWPFNQEDEVEYQFPYPCSIERSAVYWWTDGGAEDSIEANQGGLGAPSAYRVQYWDMDGSAWVDVANPHSERLQDGAWIPDPANLAYHVSFNEYDTVGFNPVTTTGIRLLMEPRPQPGDYPRSIGIQRWKVWGYPDVAVTPRITGFTATFPTISAGQLSQIVPIFKYGTGTIDHGIGPVQSGVPVSVTPSASTTYTLTVTNKKGESTSASTALTLVPLTGDAYHWPAYSPNLDYNYRQEYGDMAAPTQVLQDDPAVAGTVVLSEAQLPANTTAPWWCFRYGPTPNPLVTQAAWVPMLQRFEMDFAFFRDVMGWPPDKRAKRGYYSTVYLYGSGLADGAPSDALGGWQGSNDYQGESWPMVLLSYYPVYSFDPACPYGDKSYSQGAVVHEGIHSVLADMDGCKQAAWFQEGGNTSLQGATEAYKAALAGDPDAYASMGWLSEGSMIAPFLPIECYSGWLQDGTFGGPNAEGVNVYDDAGNKLCTWRWLLGGVQYSEAFAHFMTECVSPGSTAWIWKYCTSTVLAGLASGRHETVGSKIYDVDGLGDAQTRRLILEFRSRAATCDFGKWSGAYRKLLDDSWGTVVDPEGVRDSMTDVNPGLASWTAYPYAATTSDGAETPTLTPDSLTLPGWSGANLVPLTVAPDADVVTVEFTPMGDGMQFQLTYRAEDGTTVYSQPVAGGPCRLRLDKVPANGVVFAVAANTDYLYLGEATRKARFDYRLKLTAGLTGAADPTQKWY